MPSSITLQRTLSTAALFIRRAPLVFTGTNDPALTIGDWVRGFILSPPFAWRWNRAVTTSACIASPVTQDYSINLPNFGWLEKASFTDSTQSPPVTTELEVVLNLETETVPNLPVRIAARLDDDNGNITFRLSPPPDKTYTLNITYQKAAPTFGNLTDSWAPVPDYLHYVYHEGFLAKSYEYMGDERFPATMQMFVRQLIAANGGLAQSQVNIFMGDFVNSQRTSQDAIQNSQIANQSRSLA